MQEMVCLAAYFPNADILLFPGFTDLIDHFHRVFPAFMGDGFTEFVDQVDRVHQLAKDIELDLFVRLIADAHRLCATMTGQLRQLDLRQLLATANGVENVVLHRLAPTDRTPPPEPAPCRV